MLHCGCAGFSLAPPGDGYCVFSDVGIAWHRFHLPSSFHQLRGDRRCLSSMAESVSTVRLTSPRRATWPSCGTNHGGYFWAFFSCNLSLCFWRSSSGQVYLDTSVPSPILCFLSHLLLEACCLPPGLPFPYSDSDLQKTYSWWRCFGGHPFTTCQGQTHITWR